MRAIGYDVTGGPEVLREMDLPLPEPAAGEVRVRVAVTGVNPTDWKSRQGSGDAGPVPDGPQVPGQDGAGVIDGVGAGVDPARIGERVWLWEAAWQRRAGTTQQALAIPARQAVVLPQGASFDLGAALGIPFLTAHRCLTVHEAGPGRLAADALAGRTVLVAGGAGAVGNAAIQLARWAGARVLATVSNPGKAGLARAAGAHHTLDYRDPDAAAVVRRIVPDGVDIVVEVDPGRNAELDVAVLAPKGVVAAYAGDVPVALPVRPLMVTGGRWQFVLVYTVPSVAKDAAVADVRAALAAGVLGVGAGAGLPLHRFGLAAAADAHRAVQGNIVGKVLIDVPA